MNDDRPDPDALLAATQRPTGRLKIWFGFAPGVGKTWAMLDAAQRARQSGCDVVAGVIETHGRAETAAMVADLEQLPRRVVPWKGGHIEELDLDAALARHPQILLVDELAHTNAPGSRHPKRWQDVLELLDAGIEVHTTLNVQHVESLQEPVARATGVRVRETVPDLILDRADDIELIDLTPDELITRLQAGKVYLPAQAQRALEHFFTRGNLLALRELALRRTAARVDEDVREWRAAHAPGAGGAVERLAVAVGPAPASEGLVRAARRMADGLGAAWYAVHVEDPAWPTSDEDRARVDAHLQLAAKLGAETAHLSGRPFAEVLLAHARRHGVTRVLVGKPRHSRWRDLLRGSLLDALVRASGDIDVIVLSASGGAAPPPRPAPPVRATAWAEAILGVTAATGLGLLSRGWLSETDIVVLLLLVITGVAVRGGRGPSLLAAGLSVAAYDFFFVPPFYTLAVSDTRHLLTFLVMFAAGVTLSALTTRLRRQEAAAVAREARTSTLLALSRSLAAAAGAIADIVARAAAEAVGGPTWVLQLGPDGALAVTAGSGPPPPPELLAVARWALDHDQPAGAGTDTLSASAGLCLPLSTPGEPQGVLLLTPGRALTPEEQELLFAITRQAGLALARVGLSDELRAAALRARTEELRSALLSTVSHDLRTPLAAILGAAAVLRDTPVDGPTRDALLRDIEDHAQRMERLVRNLLEMTRLESGDLRPRAAWVPADEVVGTALADVRGRPITCAIEPPGALVEADPLLLQHALLNLLENAVRYTPDGTPIHLAVQASPGSLLLVVEDRGPGLPEGDPDTLFGKFVRGGAGTGTGLGLAIVRAVARAHGGEARALRRPGGGARFELRIPQSTPPTVPEEG